MAGGQYPGGLDSFTANVDDVDDVLAADVNELQVGIVATETELGTDPAGSCTDVKTRLAHSINDAGMLEFDDCTELTISSGAVTVTQNYHKLDTQGDAGADDLDTINGGSAGMWVVFRDVNDSRDVTLKHNTGNIYCSSGADITISDTTEFVFGIYDDGMSKWLIGKGASSSDVEGTGTNDYVAVWKSGTEIEGQDDLQWNGTTFTIGDGTAGRDYILQFDGETNNGLIYWREDEDQFLFYDDIILYSAEKIYLRDTAIGIYSQANTFLDLFADGGIRLGDSSAGAPTNYVDIKPDGEINLEGTARVTIDQWIGANGVKAPGGKPATWVLSGFKGAWEFADASAGNEQTVSGTLKIPSNMDRTVVPSFKIGWSTTTIYTDNATDDETAEWQFAYLWVAPNDDTTAAAQETLTQTTVLTAATPAEGLVFTTFTGIDLPEASDVAMFFQIKRLSATNDTIADTLQLHGMNFTYTSDRLGTAT